MTAIGQGGSSVGLSYDNANRRTCLTLPNGVLASYGYDKDSRVTSLVYGTGGSCSSPPNNLGSLTYAYEADGRRTAIAGSLAAVTLPANVTGTTSYNADNEQSIFNGTSLSYDANGNLTGDGTNTYNWDARNHLTQITQRRTTVATFAYDAFGRRMNKTVNGTTTQFLYDGLNPVQELNGSNGVVANLLTGLRVDEYFARTDTAASTFLADALGTTIGLVSSGGTIATSYTYQPFGATTTGGAGNTSTYQFTGRENDGTGLYFYRARYYSPTFRRFVSQDPIGFAGGDPNLYAYVWNSPAVFVDPRGRLGLVGLGFGAISGGIGGYFGSGGTWQGAIAGALIGGAVGLINPFDIAPGSSALTSGLGNLAGQAVRNYLCGRDPLNLSNYDPWAAGLAAGGGALGTAVAGDIADAGYFGLSTLSDSLDNAIYKGIGSGAGALLGNLMGGTPAPR